MLHFRALVIVINEINTIFNQFCQYNYQKDRRRRSFFKMVLFRSKKIKFPKQLLSNFQAEIRKSAKQLEAELKIGVAYKKKKGYSIYI